MKASAFVIIASRLLTVVFALASFYGGYGIAVGKWRIEDRPKLSKIIGFSVMFVGITLSILMVISFWHLKWAGT